MTERVPATRPSPLSRLVRTHAITTASDASIAAALVGTFFFDVPIDEARTRVTLWIACTLLPSAVVAPCLGGAVRRLPPSGRAIAAIGAARAIVGPPSRRLLGSDAAVLTACTTASLSTCLVAGVGGALATAKPLRSARVSTSRPIIVHTSNLRVDRCVDRTHAAPAYSCP